MLFFSKCSFVVTTLLLSFNRGVKPLPNIIVMQPDDMQFYDEWNPPPNNPKTPNNGNPLPSGWQLPNIEKLRTEGLWMKQAYTASPKCGTSRYSTITGRYPARSATSRLLNAVWENDVGTVTIPVTKLEDDSGLNDCSEDNLAAVLQASGQYRTGMFGKWHLSKFDEETFTYSGAQDTIKECGFDKVDGLYVENLNSNSEDYDNIHDGSFSHNMEWVTETAIEFINDDTTWGDKPFFMYLNPTVPHSPSAEEALDMSCQNTANTAINPIDEPVVKGMTLEKGGCDGYRDYVKERASSDDEMGAIWVDDAVGAIYQALEDKGILDNTIILFQLDHGQEMKAALYENGARIAQFVHYPNEISPGSEFDAPVSTIDIAPTMLEYAGITATYEMDGTSWQYAIADSSTEDEWKDERCFFMELEKDKAVRCGCFKYLKFHEDTDVSSTYTDGVAKGYSTNSSNLFDLCDGGTSYVTDKANNLERDGENVAESNACTASSMDELLQCYADRVDYREEPDYDPCVYADVCKTDAPAAVGTDVPTEAPGTQSDTPNATPTDEEEGSLLDEVLNTVIDLLLAVMNFFISLLGGSES